MYNLIEWYVVGKLALGSIKWLFKFNQKKKRER